MLLNLYLLNLVLASVESTKFTVCKSITSVGFEYNKGNKECSESTLFFEESSYVDGNQQTIKMEGFSTLKEQMKELISCSIRFEKFKVDLQSLSNELKEFEVCSSNPCVNGKCSYSNNTYLCSCDPGYTGTNCQTETNECQPDPCVNGKCRDQFNGYICHCYGGFYGKNCSNGIALYGP